MSSLTLAGGAACFQANSLLSHNIFARNTSSSCHDITRIHSQLEYG
jgi:hypothetical protein